MELSFLIGERRHELVRGHLASCAVQASEDRDGALQVRLADVNERELIVPKGARKAVRLVDPALSSVLVADLTLYPTAGFEESRRVEQAAHGKVLRVRILRQLAVVDECLVVQVVVHAPVDVVHDRVHAVGQPQRPCKGRDALLAVEQVPYRSLRTRTDFQRADARGGLDPFLRVPNEDRSDGKATANAVQQRAQVRLIPHEVTLEPRDADLAGDDAIHELPQENDLGNDFGVLLDVEHAYSSRRINSMPRSRSPRPRARNSLRTPRRCQRFQHS